MRVFLYAGHAGTASAIVNYVNRYSLSVIHTAFVTPNTYSVTS
jgi:hypothetical protein